MTVRQELQQLVADLDDTEAEELLDQARSVVARRGSNGSMPTFVELLRMPLGERSKWLVQMNFEVDMDELHAWEEGTGSDGLDDE